MKISEQLKEAEAVISNPAHWCQGWYAKDKDGNDVSAGDPTAYQYCSIGALSKNKRDINDAKEYLAKAMGVIHDYNDSHTHAEVMQKWDEAIMLAEADEKKCELS